MNPDSNDSMTQMLHDATASKVYRDQALPEHVVIVRRRMTLAQCEVMRKKAHKMVKDVKKYLKRKGL